jgi:predicted nucleic acid-binding protein
VTADVLVVDSSAVLALLLSDDPDSSLAERVAADADLHAPHLLDVEVLHALRRLTQRGELPLNRAEDARDDFAALAIARYGHEALADRAWALRENLTAYDAVFMTLAEALGAPLVTCDRALANVPGTQVDVEVHAS